MSAKPLLKLDWCSHAAAKYACEKWHYSRNLPHQKLVKIGVWENECFIGAVIFGDGANNNMFAPYGLSYCYGCELVRVALTAHQAPVSRILKIALRFLHGYLPKLRLVISYADPEQGHCGAIYQASNWFYVGTTTASDEYIVHGKRFQGRALRSTRSTHALRSLPARNVVEWAQKVLDPHAYSIEGSVKYRYLYPLDAAMRAQIVPLAQPYPKRATSSESAAPVVLTGEGGASPTVALPSS
jgi:hypothetical protein